MKRIVFWMVALLLMSGMAMAQGNRQGGRQQMDPKTRAERMTERMVKEYSLNEDQSNNYRMSTLHGCKRWLLIRADVRKIIKLPR